MDEAVEAKVEIWETPVYEVYDPWTAEVRGVFWDRDEARLFAKRLNKRKRKHGNRWA